MCFYKQNSLGNFGLNLLMDLGLKWDKNLITRKENFVNWKEQFINWHMQCDNILVKNAYKWDT